MKDDAYKATTSARFVCCILRCTSWQGYDVVCREVGVRLKDEHGAIMRRPHQSSLCGSAIEVLYCGISEEARNICCYVSRPHRSSPLLQLHARALRAYIYSGLLQLCAWTRYSLWYKSGNGYVAPRVEKLAVSLLCDAPGYPRLLYAHRQEKIVGDSNRFAQEDGYASYMQTLYREMVRQTRHRLFMLAHSGDCTVESKGELCYCRFAGGMGRSRSCQEPAEDRGRARASNWQSDLTAFLERLSQYLRPVYEASTEMQELRTLCRRFGSHQCQQGVVVVARDSDQIIPVSGTWFGTTHGQTRSQRGTSWCRIPRCFYQAMAHLCIESHFAAHQKKHLLSDTSVTASKVAFNVSSNKQSGRRQNYRRQDAAYYQLLSRYILSYGFFPPSPRTFLSSRVYAARCVQ